MSKTPALPRLRRKVVRPNPRRPRGPIAAVESFFDMELRGSPLCRELVGFLKGERHMEMNVFHVIDVGWLFEVVV